MSCIDHTSETILSKITNTCSTSITIMLCVFQGMRSSDYGGAFCIIQSSGVLRLEKTTIFNCSTSSHGGGFYYNGNTQLNVEKCCINQCWSPAMGQAHYSHMSSGSHNYYENSIKKCSFDRNNGRTVSFIESAQQYFARNNISTNQVSTYDALLFHHAQYFMTNYTNILSNVVTITINVDFSINGDLKYINIVNNSYSVLSHALFYNANNGIMNFDSCVMKYNTQYTPATVPSRITYTNCLMFSNFFSVGTLEPVSQEPPTNQIFINNVCEEFSINLATSLIKSKRKILVFLTLSLILCQ